MEKVKTFIKQNWFRVISVLIGLLFTILILVLLGSFEEDRISERKRDCLDIYKVETGKYGSGVTHWNYDDILDRCRITYEKFGGWDFKTASACQENGIYNPNLHPIKSNIELDCRDGTFIRDF